jgi:hypothetical protein
MLVKNSTKERIEEWLAPDARYQELDDARMQFTLLVAHDALAAAAMNAERSAPGIACPAGEIDTVL